jgi:hypothetical protein
VLHTVWNSLCLDVISLARESERGEVYSFLLATEVKNKRNYITYCQLNY